MVTAVPTNAAGLAATAGEEAVRCSPADSAAVPPLRAGAEAARRSGDEEGRSPITAEAARNPAPPRERPHCQLYTPRALAAAAAPAVSWVP